MKRYFCLALFLALFSVGGGDIQAEEKQATTTTTATAEPAEKEKPPIPPLRDAQGSPAETPPCKGGAPKCGHLTESGGFICDAPEGCG